jgi:DNA polymerase III delta prime subunit
MISESTHVDVLEMDAASRTGVDDIREITNSVHYQAAIASYRVYIIDEVHMLSKAAFNALLKTLEEPPPHVKFILATTDIRKIPATILSRCLKFYGSPSPTVFRISSSSIEFDAYEIACSKRERLSRTEPSESLAMSATAPCVTETPSFSHIEVKKGIKSLASTRIVSLFWNRLFHTHQTVLMKNLFEKQ